MADKYEKYATFSDDAMKDRTTSLMKMSKNGPALTIPEEESRFTEEGWDKYYFFSIPVDGGRFVPTCRAGRQRPAMIGPNTLSMSAFAPEVIARERSRIEAKDARTEYLQSFGQFKRAPSAIKQPVKLGALQNLRPPTGHMPKSSSESTLIRASQSILADHRKKGLGVETSEPQHPLLRDGPYWKPGTRLMPDYLATRLKLMQGEHRTFVDLYSEDVPASKNHCYTLGVGA
mmetsp:Transcript_45373/g.105282  ORF Transcript_45373/g.105282 Transcript_45373/m.105282 type:complete len:231 (-) Transcript_45373:45-737(-)